MELLAWQSCVTLKVFCVFVVNIDAPPFVIKVPAVEYPNFCESVLFFFCTFLLAYLLTTQ